MSDTEKKPAASEEPSKATLEETSTVTHHGMTLQGGHLDYTATAGTYVLKKEDGTALVSLFYVAYTKDGASAQSRPVTFCFNGGPGSSSVWLHMGAFGPRRVELTEDGFSVRPPGRLVDNGETLLDITDLVFIDPTTTGYSRAAKDDDAKQYHGVEKDIELVGDFIRLWTTRNKRWSSPKLLAGESYGTTRAAGLAAYLQGRHSLYLNGLLLVSSVLNFQTVMFHPGNDLPYVLNMPTYAAIAWYHGKLSPRLQKDLRATLTEVEAWASGPYAHALFMGERLSDDERDAVAQKLAEYSGLSPDFLRRAKLRIEILRFTQELLRSEHRSVGRLDGRYKGIEPDAAVEHMSYDPSLATIVGPYAACLNDYVRTELGYESDLPYELLTGRVHPWDFSKHANKYLDMSEPLREAMTHNPHLHVFVGNGYFDLGTPYFATEYTFSHLGLDPSLHNRVSMAYYEAGHMMYVHLPSLRALKADISAFVSRACQG